MSKSITLLGATYSGVPAVDLPQTGGGTARFVEPSDTTATASDVAAGKYFYTAAGVLTEGTSTGGGGGFVDVVETLPNGGQHHKISGVDLSNDTVTAAHLETGYTAHDAEGNAIVGTLSPGGGGATLITKSITANGTYNASSDNADGYSSVTVNVSGGGGGGTSEPRKDVNFFDYDGTIVASYTAVEALALNSLPSNPSHTGLTAQGWNYTLAEMKTEVTAQGKCDIGQMYITASGDTEIDVFIAFARLSPILTFALNGTVTVDWGDNTTPDSVTGSSTWLTGTVDVAHTYSKPGNYTISIHVVTGQYRFYGGSSNTLLRKNTTLNENRVYANAVQAVRFGSGVPSIGTYAFNYCTSLQYVTIPTGITLMDTNSFYYCTNLKSVTVPNTVTTITSNQFRYCYSLQSVSLPPSVTAINQSYAFGDCYALPEITIPGSITSIGTNTFNNCYSLASLTIPATLTSLSGSVFSYCCGVKEYHALRATPPSLGSSAFNGISSDCVIYVPSASLSDYQGTSNWSTYASYMQGE